MKTEQMNELLYQALETEQREQLQDLLARLDSVAGNAVAQQSTMTGVTQFAIKLSFMPLGPGPRRPLGTASGLAAEQRLESRNQ